MMDAKKIKNCSDIELLEKWKDEAYRDCVDINNCLECFHKNENDLCDLVLCSRRIEQIEFLRSRRNE